MEFEWDEEKRRINFDKHEIDFNDAVDVFDGRLSFTKPGNSEQEKRWLTTACVDDGTFITVVWTQRGGRTRIISARRARDAEKRAYRQLHNG